MAGAREMDLKLFDNDTPCFRHVPDVHINKKKMMLSAHGHNLAIFSDIRDILVTVCMGGCVTKASLMYGRFVRREWTLVAPEFTRKFERASRKQIYFRALLLV